MIIFLNTGVPRSYITSTSPVYSEELWNKAGFIALDAYMAGADHTPTEPPFSDRLVLLRQEKGFVIFPNLPFITLRQLLQHSAKHPLHLKEHHIDNSHTDPRRTFDSVPFHPVLSPEWNLLKNDEDGHATRAQLEKRVRWTTQDSDRDRLPIDLTEM